MCDIMAAIEDNQLIGRLERERDRLETIIIDQGVRLKGLELENEHLRSEKARMGAVNKRLNTEMQKRRKEGRSCG